MKKFAAALVAALALALAIGVASPAQADVNDFRFSSMEAKYSLTTDADGHSKLRTVETLTAVFPQSDQNHGIRRSLVDSYDGHPTGLKVVSVTDGSGRPRSFDVDNDDGTVVTSREKGFVHGPQTYVITYTQQNVTLQHADSGNDEFYWDVNGTDWPQSFGRVSATVTVGPKLARALTGDLTAVSGTAGSRTPATITKSSATTIRAEAQDLGAHQNLTVAIGFREGTFTARDSGVFSSPWSILSVAGGLVALLALLASLVARRGPLRDAAGRPTVVAEYRPPAGVSLPFAGHFLGKSATAAELLSLAVNGHLRLVEKPGKRKPSYSMQYVDDEGVDADGRVFLHTMFGDPLVPGKERDVVAKNRNAIQRIARLYRGIPARAVNEGYRRPYDRRRIAAILVPGLVGAAVAFVFGIVALATVHGRGFAVAALVIGLVAAVVTPLLVVRRPLTAKGAELRDHLRGLELYIEFAEADRLAFLQSPDGAQRTTVGDDEWLRLNEELLPWAALVGRQKQWSEELGRHYDERGGTPTWYAGQQNFSPAVFAASVGGFSTSTTNAFSSSSGGSTGGAVSGGGGGGGGGGGV